MDELYTNQNTNTVTDFPKPENTNASFNAPTFQEAPVSSPYYREQAAPQSVQRTVPNSVPQSVQQTIPQMNTQPVQLNKEQPQTQNFNPYSVTTQYSPTDFQAQKPKKPKNKNAFLAVIAVCLSLVISGGSFYAGVNYFDTAYVRSSRTGYAFNGIYQYDSRNTDERHIRLFLQLHFR